MAWHLPTAAERGDHNVLKVIENFRAKPPGTPEAKQLFADLLAEAERRGIAHLRSDDIPLPPLPPMPWEVHKDCGTWKQVGPCVYCVDHNERLYQGELPASRDPQRATKQAECARGGHDWDERFGQGFYYLCRRCRTKEWTE